MAINAKKYIERALKIRDKEGKIVPLILNAPQRKLYDALMLISDSAGLGIFTVYGARVAIGAGYEENLFLVLFVAVITGVGGGVMRDLFAGDRPYIFVKHVYACAALLGAIAFAALKPLVGLDGATVIGFALIVVIRFCSARFHWSLPKARL